MAIETDAGRYLLERERELEALGAAVARACEGAGGIVLIEGPAGVGKSRLCAHARSSAAALGMRVFEARGAVLEREFAYGVARQLFEQAAAPGRPEQLFSGAADLAAGLLGERDAGLPGELGDASFGVLHGLYWLTVNLADAAPLLLSVDDAHWCDSSSLSFLSYLSRRLEGLPVLLVAAGRSPDPEAGERWRGLAEDPAAVILRPQPLSEDAVGDLVRLEIGAGADDAFCRACLRATGGNPLFLRELLRALADAGVDPTADAAPIVTDVGPAAVSRFVLHRLERLGRAAEEIARALAVLGGDAELALVASAAGLPAPDARAAADLLVQADVLADDHRLRFAQPIVQAAIYEQLLPGERAARHLAAARLLKESGAAPERVAAHLVKGGPAGDPDCVAVLRAAAASAWERGDPGGAAAYLRRALDEPPPATLRAELLCDLGRAELVGLGYEQGQAHSLDAGGSAETRTRAAVWLARSAIAWGGADASAAALGALGRELETAEGERALELEAEAVTLARLELSQRGRVLERLASFEEHARGSARFEPIARIQAACERMLRGGPAGEVADEIESVLGAGPPADPYALGMAIEALVTCERHAAAARWLDQSLKVARALGLGPQLASLHAQQAMLALARGGVGDAALDAGTARELAGEGHFFIPRIVALGIQTAIERGELEAAAELAELHEDFARERVFADEFLTSRGRLHLARGDAREALADFLRCDELLAAHQAKRPAPWQAGAVFALVQLDQLDRARDLAHEAAEMARVFGAVGPLTLALRAAAASTPGDEGIDLLEEAVSLSEHSAVRLEAARAFADLGTALVKRRRRREGREVLRLALERAQKCGATALAERVRGDLGAGGGRPPRLELKGVDALTPAERRVCDLAAGELTNREVAQQLFVTEKTVELHLTSAYRKLGIRSRFQLASALSPPAG